MGTVSTCQHGDRRRCLCEHAFSEFGFDTTPVDPNIKVWVNGELTADMDMAKWTSAKTNPDGSEIPPWLSIPVAELPTKGRIGLQGKGKHGDAPVWFRNLKIKALDH